MDHVVVANDEARREDTDRSPIQDKGCAEPDDSDPVLYGLSRSRGPTGAIDRHLVPPPDQTFGEVGDVRLYASNVRREVTADKADLQLRPAPRRRTVMSFIIREVATITIPTITRMAAKRPVPVAI